MRCRLRRAGREAAGSRAAGIATRIVVAALGVLGGKTAPMVSSFRAFRAEPRDGFAAYIGPDVSIDGLLTWRTERFLLGTSHGITTHSLASVELLNCAS